MKHQYGFSKLIVRDLAASAHFYEKVFGLTDKVEVASTLGGRDLTEFIYGSANGNAAAFVLMSYKGDSSIYTGEAIVGFYTENIRQAVDGVVSHGGSIVEQTNERPDFRARIALVKDPEGHLVEIIEPYTSAE